MLWSKWFKATERIGFTPKLHEELRSMRAGTIAELTHPDGDHYVIMLAEDYRRICAKANNPIVLSGAREYEL